MMRCGTASETHHVRTADRRRGLTLFEVVLAVALFAGSMAALSQLMTTGTQAAVRSQLQTQAILRCESKLGEVLAGAVPLQAVSGTPFDDAPGQWVWSLQVLSGPLTELLEVRVTVTHQGTVPASFMLTRYLRNPQVFLDAAAAAEVESQSP